MEAKLKAKELVEKYDSTLTYLESKAKAKQCALIAVDELIYSHSQDTTDKQFYFWQEVKTEIEKL
jgi:hypothetical protein